MNNYDEFEDVPAFLMNAQDTDPSVIPDPDVTSEDLEDEEEEDEVELEDEDEVDLEEDDEEEDSSDEA